MNMFKWSIGALLALGVMGASAVTSAAEYVIDADHTSIHFRVGHFQFSQVQGRFNKISGTIRFDPANAAASEVYVVVDVSSIDTNHQARDDHMRDPTFFNVVRYPNAVFRSTQIVVTGAKTGRMTGDLTILGTTIPVTMDVKFNGIAAHPLGAKFAKYRGITVVGFSARTTISRSSFGMTNAPGEKGEIAELTIEVEAWQRP
jgi:polyisoprenoid-binding protein YceI